MKRMILWIKKVRNIHPQWLKDHAQLTIMSFTLESLLCLPRCVGALVRGTLLRRIEAAYLPLL